MGLSIKPPQGLRIGCQSGDVANKSSAVTGSEAPASKSRLGGAGRFFGLGAGRASTAGAVTSSNSAMSRQNASALKDFLRRPQKSQDQGVELDPARHASSYKNDDGSASGAWIEDTGKKLRSIKGASIAENAQTERETRMAAQGIELDPARNASSFKNDDGSELGAWIEDTGKQLRSIKGASIAENAQTERETRMAAQGIELDPARHASSFKNDDGSELGAWIEDAGKQLRSIKGASIAENTRMHKDDKKAAQGD
jgi:UDP-N-acetylenolpyruvoylglucosamine reductase